eukprot:74400-Chlamydomonas_euryale.AAC.1
MALPPTHTHTHTDTRTAHLAKLVHNEFCVAAQRLARPWVEKRRERAEHVKVAQDGRLDVGALHLDRDRLAGVAQHGLVDLAGGSKGV